MSSVKPLRVTKVFSYFSMQIITLQKQTKCMPFGGQPHSAAAGVALRCRTHAD